MPTVAETIAAAMPDLLTWVGRKRVVHDDISLTMVRRIAAMLDVDPASFERGSPVPRHWFNLFFADTPLQRELGPDGHPDKGVVLPPIPLPRRMGAGRKVRIFGELRVGTPATRTAEVIAIQPKRARTGEIVVLTMRHTVESAGDIIGIEDFDAIYREGLAPGEKNPIPQAMAPPADAAWQTTVGLEATLVFRYSAITWNAHRIHYDADYARGEERYTGVVQNGGLTMQLLLEAAVPHLPAPITGFEARLTMPVWVGDPLRIEGATPKDGQMNCWGVDKAGALAARMTVEYAT